MTSTSKLLWSLKDLFYYLFFPWGGKRKTFISYFKYYSAVVEDEELRKKIQKAHRKLFFPENLLLVMTASFLEGKNPSDVSSILFRTALEGKRDINYFTTWRNPAYKTCESPVLYHFTNRRPAALTVAYLVLSHWCKTQGQRWSEKQQNALWTPRNADTHFRARSLHSLPLSWHMINSTFLTFWAWKCNILPYLTADLGWYADKFWIWSKCRQIFHRLYQRCSSNSALVAVLFREITIQSLEIKSWLSSVWMGFFAKLKEDGLILQF